MSKLTVDIPAFTEEAYSLQVNSLVAKSAELLCSDSICIRYKEQHFDLSSCVSLISILKNESKALLVLQLPLQILTQELVDIANSLDLSVECCLRDAEETLVAVNSNPICLELSASLNSFTILREIQTLTEDYKTDVYNLRDTFNKPVTLVLSKQACKDLENLISVFEFVSNFVLLKKLFLGDLTWLSLDANLCTNLICGANQNTLSYLHKLVAEVTK